MFLVLPSFSQSLLRPLPSFCPCEEKPSDSIIATFVVIRKVGLCQLSIWEFQKPEIDMSMLHIDMTPYWDICLTLVPLLVP